MANNLFFFLQKRLIVIKYITQKKKTERCIMEIIVADNYMQMSEIASRIISRTLISNPEAVLGLATGTSPILTYKHLAENYAKGMFSFKKVHTVNLDEYVGLSEDNDQSYHFFMNDNLFKYTDLPKENVHIPNGLGDDLNKNCLEYDEILKKYPRDLQLLGIGGNGHIGFNEPGTPFKSNTHIVNLTERTIKDNSRLFADPALVPKKAITMGILGICQAKKVLVLASGKNKADAVYGMVKGDVTEACPASVLQLHNDVTLVVDRAAAEKIL